jgi:hypothetical protein
MTTQLYPVLKEAIKSLEKEGRTYGDTLSLEWLYKEFGIDMPRPGTPYHEAEKAMFKFLSVFKQFEKEMLENKQMALANIRTKGYRIVPPNEQTKWSEEDGIKTIKKALKLMYIRQTNVAFDLLTSEERKDNADSLARLSMLKVMVDKTSRKLLPNHESRGL